MGISLGSLVSAGGTAEEAKNNWKIAGEREQLQQALQKRELEIKQQQADAAAKREGAQADYYSGRNNAYLQGVREREAAAAAERDAVAKQRAADLAERNRHNEVMEHAAMDKVAAEREFHRQSLKGDPLPTQIRNAAMKLYEQYGRSPGKDMYGRPLPEPSGDVVAARVRTSLRAVYGPIVDSVLPPPATPDATGASTPASDAVGGYQREMQAAFKLHQQALDNGHDVKTADQLLTDADRALHAKYGLTPAGTPLSAPAPGANGTTPRTAFATSAPTTPLRPAGQGAAPVSGITGVAPTGGLMDQFARMKSAEEGAVGGASPQQPAGPAYAPPTQPPRPPTFAPTASTVLPPPRPAAPLATVLARPGEEEIDEDDYGGEP